MEYGNYFKEAFQKLSLLEQDFPIDADKDKTDELAAFIADDREAVPEEPVFDTAAENEDELQDNYIGKVIIECECCHSKFYKEPDDVIIDEETELANVDEECPFCNATMGYTIIGKIEPFDEKEPTEDEVEIDDIEVEDEVEEEPVEEVEEEEVEESLQDRIRRRQLTEAEESNVGSIKSALDNEFNYAIKNKGKGPRNIIWFYGPMDNFGEKVQEWFSFKKNLVPVTDVKSISDLNKTFKKGTILLIDDYNSIGDKISLLTALADPTKASNILFTVIRTDNYSDISKQTEKDLINHQVNLGDKKLTSTDAQPEEAQPKTESLTEAKKEFDTSSGEVSFWLSDEHTSGQNGQFYGYIVITHPTLGEFTTGISSKGPIVSRDKEVWNFIKKEEPDLTPEQSKWLIDHAEELKYIYKEGIPTGNLTESLTEDFKDVSITTDDQHLEMTSDENGKVTVTTESINEEEEDFNSDWAERDSMGNGELLDEPDETSGQEEIVPLTDEEAAEIEANSEEKAEEEPAEEEAPAEEESEETEGEPEEAEGEEEEEFTEFGEEEFENVGESYVRRVYENVKSFKTTGHREEGDTLIVEGLITFNSGNTKKTTFTFTNPRMLKGGKVVLEGYNRTFTKTKKAFSLKGRVEDKKFITESLGYHYIAKKLNESVRVNGRVKRILV